MIMEAEQAIKACGMNSQKHQDVILGYSTYKRILNSSP